MSQEQSPADVVAEIEKWLAVKDGTFDRFQIQTLLQQLLPLVKSQQWQTIETAPKDRSKIMAWREDCGVFMAQWTCCADFMCEGELEDCDMSEESLHQYDWFSGDTVPSWRLEDDLAPTYWMPLPQPPSLA